MSNPIKSVNEFDPHEALNTWTKGLEDLTLKMKSAGYGTKNDPPLNPQQPYVHGAGGLLSPYGQDATVFSAMMLGQFGLATALPVVTPSQDYYGNLYGMDQADVITVITGQTEGDDDFSDQKTGWCDDAPIAGVLKACSKYMPYGHYEKSIRELNIPRVIARLNRSEPTDLSLVNNWSAMNNPFTPAGTSDIGSTLINQELLVRTMEAAQAFARMLGRRGYIGTPSNNSGAAQDMLGVDEIYNTGGRDFFTNTLCPAADSQVYSFRNNNAATDQINGWYLYDYVEWIYRNLKDIAARAGLTNVQWKLTMKRDLFNVLTDNINVQRYVRTVNQMLVLNGNTGQGGQVIVSGSDEDRLRQAMREGRYLPIDGENVAVEVDDAIAETFTPSNGENTSSIYFHPISANGIPITFWDYANFASPQAQQIVAKLGNAFAYTTDGGRFFWSQSYKNGCYKAQFETFVRIKCRAPFLAGRLTDINYLPLIHSRSAYPDNTSYFVNGGRTNSPLPVGFPDWLDGTSTTIGNAG